MVPASIISGIKTCGIYPIDHDPQKKNLKRVTEYQYDRQSQDFI